MLTWRADKENRGTILFNNGINAPEFDGAFQVGLPSAVSYLGGVLSGNFIVLIIIVQ